MSSKVELPKDLIEKLSNLPEQGMGYQVVNVLLKDGQVLKDRRVVNSTFLLLYENELVSTNEIEDVELNEK